MPGTNRTDVINISASASRPSPLSSIGTDKQEGPSMAHQQNLTPGAGVYKEEPTSVAGDPVSTVNYPYPYLDSYPTYLLPLTWTQHFPPFSQTHKRLTHPYTPHTPLLFIVTGTLYVLFHTRPCPKVIYPKLFSLHRFYSLVLHHPALSSTCARPLKLSFLCACLPCLTEKGLWPFDD